MANMRRQKWRECGVKNGESAASKNGECLASKMARVRRRKWRECGLEECKRTAPRAATHPTQKSIEHQQRKIDETIKR